MVKGTILEDTFEKLVEHGGKATKTASQQIKQTVSPKKMWEQLLGISSDSEKTSEVDAGNKKTSEVKKGGNHTLLDFEKLNKSYQNQDKQKTDALRQRLFQLVKSGEEKAIMQKKKEEEERKKKEYYELQEKKKKEEEKKQQEQSAETPKGKVRKSIFSHKKVAERSHAETKPATGKQ